VNENRAVKEYEPLENAFPLQSKKKKRNLSSAWPECFNEPFFFWTDLTSHRSWGCCRLASSGYIFWLDN